jgi:predicted DNA-binding ribbon-helix-helix protein
MESSGAASDAALRKRSVTIAGHRTSLSLEEAFWRRLKAIARARRQSLNQVIAEIDEARTGNLSSAVRVFVLNATERR